MDPKYKNIGNVDDHVIEECSEVIKAIIKSKRFGLYNYHPDTPHTNNKQKILDELNDLGIVLTEYRQYLYEHKEDIKNNCNPCCWHDTGIMLTSNPPLTEQVCCHCNNKKHLSQNIKIVNDYMTRHGKFHPKITGI